MRRLFLIVGVIVASAAVSTSTAWADWFENFDGYVPGSQLHGQGGWRGWDGSPGAGALVSAAQSHSPGNSVDIIGAADLVQQYVGSTTGTWTYSAWQYIPTSFTGQSYFILLNTYAEFGPYNWSSQVQFDGGAGIVMSEFDGAILPMIRGQWVELEIVIDLDNDLQTFSYGGTVLYIKSWREGVSGLGVSNIAAVDLFANGAGSIYYDDMALEAFSPTATEPNTWGGVKNLFR